MADTDPAALRALAAKLRGKFSVTQREQDEAAAALDDAAEAQERLTAEVERMRDAWLVDEGVQADGSVRPSVSATIARAEHAEAEAGRLREALEYYADESCWENDIMGEGEELTLWVANGNGTEIARTALAQRQQQTGAGDCGEAGGER